MSEEINNKVSYEEIEAFLLGKDEQKYITNIEAPYHINQASLIINHPIKGKYIEKHTYKPFLWMKESVSSILYGGDRELIKKKAKEFGVKFKKLRTTASNGFEPIRLKNGFKYLVTCDHSYSKLQSFFKNGGVDVYQRSFKFENETKDDLDEHEIDLNNLFITLSPTEQFLIQSGKRLFKGMDDYNDVHKLSIDLETEGLNPKIHAIKLCGLKDNKDFKAILKREGETNEDIEESERQLIKNTFKLIYIIKPDIICGYNSANFDWPFIFTRCEILGLNPKEIIKTLNPEIQFSLKQQTLKLGGEVENYQQLNMWGFSVLDVSHSVRRAQAIDSNIKEWNLKYITKYSKIAKENRVYVSGNIIDSTLNIKSKDYIFHEKSGKWEKYDEGNEKHVKALNKNCELVSGEYIVERYLYDDLWETESVDNIYNQATFLLSKIIPTSYQRSATMGTAGTWKLIMSAFSYERDLAIPDFQPKKNFVGGLSRLLRVGFAKDYSKFDYAALYPKIELTHDTFPEFDILGGMKMLLLYIVDNRDKYKDLKGVHSKIAKNLIKEGKVNEAKTEEALAYLYDKKQLPLKILANSFFGSFGAPYIFPWGDLMCAEETTCRGRQYLRLMVSHFSEKHGFKPLVGDTDGFNFEIPKDIDKFKYTPKGTHTLTKENKNKELIGVDAVVAEFNEKFMTGYMGLDIDEVGEATINFKRKNYATMIGGKVKLVGNMIKSKKMPIYIEEFVDTAIRLLLEGKGKDFIDFYYDYVDLIYNYKIPIMKIASKSKIKLLPKDYLNRGTDKNGRLKARQAHMELVIKNDINVNQGDVIYYFNTGSKKSEPDVKSIKNEDGTDTIILNCKMINNHDLINNPNLVITEYNVIKYLSALNTRIKPLLVCFKPEIRDQILINVVKDKKTKLDYLENRSYFTESECELDSGNPLSEEHQNTWGDLMNMEDKEIDFWVRANKIPNNINEEEFNVIKEEYLERKKVQDLEDLENEKKLLTKLVYSLEIEEIDILTKKLKVPDRFKSHFSIRTIDNKVMICSNKLDNKPIKPIKFLMKFESDAIERKNFYDENNLNKNKNKFLKWLNHLVSTKGIEVIESEWQF